MGKALSRLIEDINVEKIELNIFRGVATDAARSQVYGGQVLAQAMNAAASTVASRLELHSLHAYFLREGLDDTPIVYEVDRIRDGKAFTTRRVVAIQHGRAIFNISLSYQLPEVELIAHCSLMPKVEGPDGLMNDEVYYQSLLGVDVQQAWPIEYRQVGPVSLKSAERKPALQYVWFKAQGELADDKALHQQLLAYASDHLLLKTALRPHGLHAWNGQVRLASLDHALWFHQPCRMDEWHLYEMESTVATAGRAFCRGRIFNQQGHLVASTSQEGSVRA